MFDPENVQRYIREFGGMEKLSKDTAASTDPEDVYVKASDFNQLLAFYRAVPHSGGHVDCPSCDATRDMILAGVKTKRLRREAGEPLSISTKRGYPTRFGNVLKLVKK